MSYCRWSSDFGECDVYVYEHVDGGWATHVASRRLNHRVPDEIRQMPRNTAKEYSAAYSAERAWRDAIPSDEIPCRVAGKDGKTEPGIYRTPKETEYLDLATISPLAGETFRDETPGDCANRLELIRKSGLNVPQYAIDALRAEQIEMNN